MARRLRNTSIAFAVALAVAVPAAAGPRAASSRFHLTSSTITLGRSIGNLKIGMTIAQVAAYLGPGQLLNSRHKGVVSFYQYGNPSSGSYTALFAGHPRIAVNIGEHTGVMHTPEGIRLGSTLAQLEAAYPQLQCETGLREAQPESATGFCDLHQPRGRATRFGLTHGEVDVIGVARSAYISQLR
jgi:hypothetical protein